MKERFDYGSRFKILKGGRVSLIVSALVTSVTLSFASPSGGVVTSGSATISQNANITNINQSSQKASINWNKFNIASNETVNFNQPSINSITLNRVIGNERSIINGALNANGQVWILNSNGVLFGKNAKVNTSGLLATTASLSDEAFQSGNYSFKNATSNSIINEGTIKVNNSSYVILASNETRNAGSIEAVKATVHLVGANEYSINLNGNSLVDLTIDKGVMDALVENSGTIINKAGEVYLTSNAVDELLKGVVNHTGIIEANSLDELTGKVELFAHGGTTSVDGTIKAKEGFVETSGKDFKILDNATIEAGKWLIDPTNLTVDSVLASLTQSQLINGDVEFQADEDITVEEKISWSTDTRLTLTAGDKIYVYATIENTNNSNGGVYFKAANTQDKVIFGANGKVIINNIYQLQWISQALNGTYELGKNINAGATTTWNSDGSDGYYGFDPIGDFKGTFDGNGHAIDTLYINRPNENDVGLFRYVRTGGTVTNIGLTNVNITGKYYIGGLVGVNYGTLTNSYATGSVSGNEYVGGLVGLNYGTITNSYATGSVDGSPYVGGLVGYNEGTLSNSYATGRVSGHSRVGGLVGLNYGTLSNSYATGSVSGTNDIGGLVGYNRRTISNSYATGSVSGANNVGGLVGLNRGTIKHSYWDIETSGQSSSAGGTGLSSEEMGYGGTYDSSWNIEIDNTLTSGNAPLLRYNPDGSATWIIAPLRLSYTLENQSWTYDGISYSLSSFYNDSALLFGSDYDFIDSSAYSFIDGSDSTITSVRNAGTYRVGLKSENSFLSMASTGNSKAIITINKKEITATYSADDKTYDGTTLAYVNGSLDGIISGDSVSLLNQSANFEDKNAGENKQVNITNIALSGNDALNYVVSDTTTSATINKKGITATYSADNKTYDGTTLANVNGSLNDAISGDSISLIQSANFEDKNAGSNKQVNITNIALSGDDALNYTLTSPTTATTNATINKKGITATYSAEDKTYDGTTLANVHGSLNDAINGDNISLIQSANYIDKNAGTNKKINITNIALSGDDASNYTLTSPTTATTNATINKKGITATYSAEDKTYDGTTLANVHGSLNDAINGDNISLIQSANYIDKNAGTNKKINITNIALSGDDASNYTLTSPTTATTNATINKKGITATYSADDKTYDGTTLVNVNGSLAGGIISGDSVFLLNQSANFEDKNAGENKQVNITNIALSGDDALNYVVSDTTTNATINKKGITATYSAEDKTYDGTTTATVSGSLSDVISGDSVSLLNQSANFEDKNAGENKQVNITNIALSGDDALNYTLTSPTTATTSATINKKGITATYSAEDKTYDGTTLANVHGSLNDAINGDNISLIQSANYIDKNAGTNKKINITNIALSGDDALNYTLTSPTTATTNANINQKEITVTYSAEDKTYDGTTTATVSGSLNGGIISGDSVSLLNQSANFEDKNAGENKQVNITNIALSGDDALNYVVSDTTTSATINKKGITATYSAEDKTYDGTTLAHVNGSLDGIISGDSVSLLNQSANFEDKNAGENKNVLVSSISLDGDDAKNYKLASTSYITNADITPKVVEVRYSADDKIYDGTTLAYIRGSIEGILKGDKVSFISGEGYFKDSIPGINKTVYIEGFRLEGKDSKNYVLDADSYTTIASINIDLEDIIGSVKKEAKEYTIKNYFINFNPIVKEIVLEIINEGIKLPKKEMTQSLFFNNAEGDEI